MRQAILRPVVAQIYGGEKVKPGDKSKGYSLHLWQNYLLR